MQERQANLDARRVRSRLPRLAQAAREHRDQAIESLRATYAPKFAAIDKQRERAESAASEAKTAAAGTALGAFVSLGGALLESVLTRRKLTSRDNIRRAESAVRSSGKALKQRSDAQQAAQSAASLDDQQAQLEAELKQKIAEFDASVRPDAFQLSEIRIGPRKSDISVESVSLAWTPWGASPDGAAEPLFNHD